MTSRPTRARAIGGVAWAALESSMAAVVIVPAVAGLFVSPDRALQLVAVLVSVGLALLLARVLAALTRSRLDIAGGAGRWLCPGSLGWLATTLLLRAPAVTALVALVMAAATGLVSPVVVAGGSWVDLGPWRIDTTSEAALAVLVALTALALLWWALPVFIHGDQALAGLMLTDEQAELQRELAETANSRARIIAAHDQERRRIERDLHDGVQPELLGVSMTLGLAVATMSENDPARELVVRAQQQSLDVLESLRRFVRGVHPQVLDDHGLVAAIGELAGTLPTPVTVDDQLPARLAPEVEASLYYATAELLTNVVKHSGASRAGVTLRLDDGDAVVVVHDDGRGGADPAGRGLTGVRDRLAALGGTLVLDSPSGGPTTATVRLKEAQ